MAWDRDDGVFIELRGWPGAIVVLCLVIGGFWLHDRLYYHNPDFETQREALESDDPARIGAALLDIGTLTMGRGHGLVPYLLPLLRDERPLPPDIEQRMIRGFQAAPGAIPGMEDHLRGRFTLGFTTALTLKGLIMMREESTGWVARKARNRITEYVLDDIGPEAGDEALKNALVATWMVYDERLLPFRFACLARDDERVRMHALSGLYFYAYDRNHGLFDWHPEEEITPDMFAQLRACARDPHLRRHAEQVLGELAKAGMRQ